MNDSGRHGFAFEDMISSVMYLKDKLRESGMVFVVMEKECDRLPLEGCCPFGPLFTLPYGGRYSYVSGSATRE